MVSARGQLLDALAPYARALHGQPGASQRVELLAEVRDDVVRHPDPQAGAAPPPTHGQTTGGELAPSDAGPAAVTLIIGGSARRWPDRSSAVRQLRGHR